MDTKQTAILRAVALLKAAGVQYKVIVDEATSFGDLEVKPPKAAKARKHYGDFKFKPYVLPIISEMQPGDVKFVPLPPGGPDTVDVPRLQTAISATAGQVWGNGNAITSRGKGGVEVMRVA